jgi:uncharacterized protein (DUF1330 family)
MKIRYPVSLATIGVLSIGALAVQTLQAQSTPKGYIIAAIEVTGNPEIYKRDYVDRLAATYAPFGARYIARQARPIDVQGEPPRGYIVIIEFDSVDKAKGWLNSPEFLKIKPVRDRETKTQAYLVEGVPLK